MNYRLNIFEKASDIFNDPSPQLVIGYFPYKH
jgi:hypothetical protein